MSASHLAGYRVQLIYRTNAGGNHFKPRALRASIGRDVVDTDGAAA